MKIIKPYHITETEIDYNYIVSHIEKCGRTCYKSDARTGEEFIRTIIKKGHESVLEHYSITVRVICDRGVSHEIVRHRIASYSQSSTRYCDYSKDKFGNELTVIEPCFWAHDTFAYKAWINHMTVCEKLYMQLRLASNSPEEARSILPHSIATELVMTMNLREWRHFFKLRTAKSAHPQMIEIANMILEEFKEMMPVFFEDIEVNE